MTLPYQYQDDQVDLNSPFSTSFATGIKQNFDFIGPRLNDFGNNFSYSGVLSGLQSFLRGNPNYTSLLRDFRSQEISNNGFLGTITKLQNTSIASARSYYGGGVAETLTTLTRSRPNMSGILAKESGINLSQGSTIKNSLTNAGVTAQSVTRLGTDDSISVQRLIIENQMYGLKVADSINLNSPEFNFDFFKFQNNSSDDISFSVKVDSVDRILNIIWVRQDQIDMLGRLEEDYSLATGLPKDASNLSKIFGYVHTLQFPNTAAFNSVINQNYTGQQFIIMRTPGMGARNYLFKVIESDNLTLSITITPFTVEGVFRETIPDTTLYLAAMTTADNLGFKQGVWEDSSPTGNDSAMVDGDWHRFFDTAARNVVIVDAKPQGTSLFWLATFVYSQPSGLAIADALDYGNFVSSTNLSSGGPTLTNLNFSVGDTFEGQLDRLAYRFLILPGFSDTTPRFRYLGTDRLMFQSFAAISQSLECISINGAFTRPVQLNGFVPSAILLEFEGESFGSHLARVGKVFAIRPTSYTDGGTVSFRAILSIPSSSIRAKLVKGFRDISHISNISSFNRNNLSALVSIPANFLTKENAVSIEGITTSGLATIDITIF